MPSPTDHLDTVRRYLKAVESGSFADIAGLLAPDMVMEQLPNRIYPHGLRGTVSQMADGFERGRKLLSHQTYEIKNALVNDNAVAVEVFWTGTLALTFGNLSAGAKMRAHSAMFFEFKDGKISSQRNYDCFEPW
ncbi:MAG TPA: nuclear transport factor 2 family protein [Candidatus Dormibacteraeota bacterium]|nr:nuclear transport factor 2 family protein [Candidatus Dormibacteraeota bacterium]